jgi:uncharacterized protein YndB with AHSA1/START domain
MIGQTKDAGFQIGVSKTLPHPVDEVWAFLTSAEGLATWLGPGAELKAEKGTAYRTSTGTTGEVRSWHDRDRIRLTWRPADWDHDSTVQVTVRPNGDERTVLRFHQERLTGPAEREQQRTHWRRVMATVSQALEAARHPGQQAGRRSAR